MPIITRFEELNCWKESRLLVNKIYLLSSSGKFGRDYAFKDQIRRASVSVMTNIAEGFARFHTRDSIRFMNFAQSSASEVQSLLYLAEDLNYLSPEKADELREQSLHCQKMILSLIKHLKSKTK